MGVLSGPLLIIDWARLQFQLLIYIRQIEAELHYQHLIAASMYS